MTKKTVQQPQDKYVLRLPDGLRDRIKNYAQQHGRSMNAEIVRILEREFPPPLSLEARVDDLVGLVEVMRSEGVKGDHIDRLNDELYEVLKGIAIGRVKGVDDDYREHVKEQLSGWEHEQMRDSENRYTENMDQEELDAMWLRGNPFKNDA